MTLLGLRTWRARSSAAAATRADLKDRVRRLLTLRDDDSVSCNETNCGDPGCPDAETVILIMKYGEPTRAFKLPLAMTEITDLDLEALSALIGANANDL